MRFQLTTNLNDGLAEAPAAITGELRHLDELMPTIREELTDDNGEYLPVGATVTIERVS